MEGLVTVIAQDLVLGLVLAPTHTARTELAFPALVVLTVSTVRLLLAGLSLPLWIQGWVHGSMSVWEYDNGCVSLNV